LPLVTIYIAGPGGRYATNVEAVSSDEAMRTRVQFFLGPFPKGPTPKAATILRLCPTGEKEIRVRVPAG
jgi:hypothetical protein